ncbi:MAG: hypothetical protein J5688_02270 [Paludibacteraceae bacterium]|nr:hypothetical protein [Paludibacteraceae bacterium]
MRVELPDTIRSISGKMGSFIFKTRIGPDGEPRVFAHHVGRPRSTPATEHEKYMRHRFGQIAKVVHAKIKAGDQRPRPEIWQEVAAAYDAADNERLTTKEQKS